MPAVAGRRCAGAVILGMLGSRPASLSGGLRDTGRKRASHNVNFKPVSPARSAGFGALLLSVATKVSKNPRRAPPPGAARRVPCVSHDQRPAPNSLPSVARTCGAGNPRWPLRYSAVPTAMDNVSYRGFESLLARVPTLPAPASHYRHAIRDRPPSASRQPRSGVFAGRRDASYLSDRQGAILDQSRAQGSARRARAEHRRASPGPDPGEPGAAGLLRRTRPFAYFRGPESRSHQLA